MPTISPNWQRRHDKLGAACFTSAVFSVAMLPKMAPFEVTARELLLVVKAHVFATVSLATSIGDGPGAWYYLV